MTTVSTAPTTTTTTKTANTSALTPPSSPPGNGNSWDLSAQQYNDAYGQKRYSRTQTSKNGVTLTQDPTNIALEHVPYNQAVLLEKLPDSAGKEASGFVPSYHGQENIQLGHFGETGVGLAESPMDLSSAGRNETAVGLNKRAAGADTHGSVAEDVSSKWIHRDKLARIESEELQAAGIILPKSRARSRPRRDVSIDRAPTSTRKSSLGVPDGDVTESRSRKSSPNYSDRKIQDISTSSWDLRLPEEIEAEAYFAPPAGSRGMSRIPVAKASPAPLPYGHIERDTPMSRKRDDSPGAEESIVYPKPRSRSVGMRDMDDSSEPTAASPQRNLARSASDLSPKKLAGSSATSLSSSRKGSTSTKTNATGAGRPRTRNEINKDSISSGTRPSTRSGERDLSRELSSGAASKQPEGEPPWMISAYRPDPRLPPDQQLLPTVAKRLQQEKWEREGKFGNIYDKEFRPLTDEGFPCPPGPSENPPGTTTSAAADEHEVQGQWPLKPEVRTPTSHQGRSGSYSTIPRIQDKPVMVSPLPSPLGTAAAAQVKNAAPPEPENGGKTKDGCGCCIIM